MASSNGGSGGAPPLAEILRRHWLWWLAPMIGVWLLFLAVVWLSQDGPAQPFLYSLF